MLFACEPSFTPSWKVGTDQYVDVDLKKNIFTSHAFSSVINNRDKHFFAIAWCCVSPPKGGWWLVVPFLVPAAIFRFRTLCRGADVLTAAHELCGKVTLTATLF